MEAIITSGRVEFKSKGSSAVFRGDDILSGAVINEQTPTIRTVVRLYLADYMLPVYKTGYYDVDFRAITNQPTWTSKPATEGAFECLTDLTPVFRKCCAGGGGGGGQVDTIVAGDGIDVDATDPANPEVSVRVDGVTVGFNGLGELEVPAGGGGYVPTTRTITTTAPLTGGGDLSVNRVFAMPQASAVADGFLDSADWATFNGRQPAGNYITALTGDVVATGPGSVAATIQPDSVTNAKLDNVPASTFKGSPVGAGTVNPVDLTADQASTILDTATDPFVRTSAASTGDVVGPASAVDGNVVQFDGTTGKLIKDGLGTSTGGNGVADAGKLSLFGADGSLTAESATGPGIVSLGTSASFPAFTTENASGGPIAYFRDSGVLPAFVVDAFGGLEWRDLASAQSTVDNLPVFGALTQGVVPAAGAVPSAANFLTETGVFAVPPGTTNTVGTVSRAITQAAHGFAVGDLVKYTGAAYAKAQADVEANGEVVGIVSAVAGVNDFTMTTHGYVTGLSGLTSGTTYFLSEITAGLLTATAPSTTGNVRKAQLIALSTTTGHYNNFVGYIIP